MKDATLMGQAPRTKKELKAQADQLAVEIRYMLDEARRNTDEAARLRAINRKTLDELEKLILCGKA